ncbi:hypothetical protein [Fluviicola sp.]|uniref:hypothetical protein n=1 Tax=Fluviicola sp. TaxID=1917219 RepID=UPI003D28EA2C
MQLKEFKQNLGLTDIPTELEKLIHFQNTVSDFEEYSQGFGVLIDDKSGIKSWSEDEAFLERLFPFAQANGSGSIYAVWNDGSSKAFNELPVVVFGDEGGVHVVAENLLALLQLLTFDSEISVDHEEVYFYKDEEDYEESEGHASYKNWLKEQFGLEPIENPDELIERAQEKYKADFDSWFTTYYKD